MRSVDGQPARPPDRLCGRGGRPGGFRSPGDERWAPGQPSGRFALRVEEVRMGVWASAWASARIAVRALRVNKLRSALTMLGIVIGVGAVITMVAVGSGAQARVAEQIQSLGSNLIIVLSGSVTSSGVRMGTSSQQTITEDDATGIGREIPAVQAVAPSVRGNAQVVFGTALAQ